MKKAIEIEPDNIRNLLGMSFIEIMYDLKILKRDDGAQQGIYWVDKVLQIDIENIEAWERKATILQGMDKHKQAAYCFGEAKKIRDKHKKQTS